MEAKLMKALDTEKFELLKPEGKIYNDICPGTSYSTDSGPVLIKTEESEHALEKFNGEMESLVALRQTNTILVPKPISVINLENSYSAAIIFEGINIETLTNSIQMKKFGTQLAKLHLSNGEMIRRVERKKSFINRSSYSGRKNSLFGEEGSDDGSLFFKPIYNYGFNAPTYSGDLALNNDWQDNWAHWDQELNDLWGTSIEKVEMILNRVKKITPSLLHGNLWELTVGVHNDEPILFNPCSFYGHNEMDFGLIEMTKCFNEDFFNSYYSIYPRATGAGTRRKIYTLFHLLNHWNHFGGDIYRAPALKIMNRIIGS